MQYREHVPHATLAELVRCFWTLEMEHAPGSVQEVTPDGCVELIFNFGSPYVPLGEGAADALPVAFVVGFQNRTVSFRVDGTVRVVAARLHPWGALALLPDDGGTSSNSVRGLGADWSELTTKLETRVAQGDYDGAVGVLQERLIEQALLRNYNPQIVQAAAKLLHRTQGQFRIEELAAHCEISVRQLERGFHKVLGTSPKNFARTMRFDRAQQKLMFEPDVDLTQLALECGYFDQAHFSKDFKEIAGRSPSEYAALMRRLHAAWKNRDVVFLQARTAGLRDNGSR